ncbi:MAG: hypothetical protein WC307_03600 [Candidatus Nanoarchaeia archaeon]|jgi:hypothetical protein
MLALDNKSLDYFIESALIDKFITRSETADKINRKLDPARSLSRFYDREIIAGLSSRMVELIKPLIDEYQESMQLFSQDLIDAECYVGNLGDAFELVKHEQVKINSELNELGLKSVAGDINNYVGKAFKFLSNPKKRLNDYNKIQAEIKGFNEVVKGLKTDFDSNLSSQLAGKSEAETIELIDQYLNPSVSSQSGLKSFLYKHKKGLITSALLASAVIGFGVKTVNGINSLNPFASVVPDDWDDLTDNYRIVGSDTNSDGHNDQWSVEQLDCLNQDVISYKTLFTINGSDSNGDGLPDVFSCIGYTDEGSQIVRNDLVVTVDSSGDEIILRTNQNYDVINELSPWHAQDEALSNEIVKLFTWHSCMVSSEPIDVNDVGLLFGDYAFDSGSGLVYRMSGHYYPGQVVGGVYADMAAIESFDLDGDGFDDIYRVMSGGEDQDHSFMPTSVLYYVQAVDVNDNSVLDQGDQLTSGSRTLAILQAPNPGSGELILNATGFGSSPLTISYSGYPQNGHQWVDDSLLALFPEAQFMSGNSSISFTDINIPFDKLLIDGRAYTSIQHFYETPGNLPGQDDPGNNFDWRDMGMIIGSVAVAGAGSFGAFKGINHLSSSLSYRRAHPKMKKADSYTFKDTTMGNGVNHKIDHTPVVESFIKQPSVPSCDNPPVTVSFDELAYDIEGEKVRFSYGSKPFKEFNFKPNGSNFIVHPVTLNKSVYSPDLASKAEDLKLAELGLNKSKTQFHYY